jgi:hypothetical protein
MVLRCFLRSLGTLNDERVCGLVWDGDYNIPVFHEYLGMILV